LQGIGIRGPFPAEPYLAPSNSCPLDTQALGPEQQLAIPINYHLLLSLSDSALYQPGDTTGRVAAGFGGSVNITLHVEQVSWTPLVGGSMDSRALEWDLGVPRLPGALDSLGLVWSLVAMDVLGHSRTSQTQHKCPM
jgi:hypothetical protein